MAKRPARRPRASWDRGIPKSPLSGCTNNCASTRHYAQVDKERRSLAEQAATLNAKLLHERAYVLRVKQQLDRIQQLFDVIRKDELRHAAGAYGRNAFPVVADELEGKGGDHD